MRALLMINSGVLQKAREQKRLNFVLELSSFRLAVRYLTTMENTESKVPIITNPLLLM
jgi:hypothetical protein